MESYSRILESLAYTVMSRIEDVLHADSLAENPSLGEKKRHALTDTSLVMTADTFPNAKEELERLKLSDAPTSMTLSDFMGWTLDNSETKKDSTDDLVKENDTKPLSKPHTIVTNKKLSYIEKLENLGGLRSPTARH